MTESGPPLVYLDKISHISKKMPDAQLLLILSHWLLTQLKRLVSHLCNEFVQSKMTNSKRLKFWMWTFTSLWAYIRARYIYIFCSFLFFAKMMFTFYKRPIVHIILLIRLGLFWWKKKVWFSIWSCSPRKQTQTQLTILTQRPRVLLSAKCCHTASIREQAAIQHCNKKCIWHFLSYLQFSWMLHCSEWWLQIPGDNPAHSPFKTGILMAPIRDGHLSSDIVVFILAFCLFCGNCVCTQAYGINRWQSFLSEASPRHLSHPLCRAVWDKFIRNICTGLQYRQWCILCIFCTLGSTNRSKRWKDTFCKRPFLHSGLLSSLNCAWSVHCEPGANVRMWMYEGNM